jgi:N-acetylmuramoyl-L-alanine amidase
MGIPANHAVKSKSKLSLKKIPMRRSVAFFLLLLSWGIVFSQDSLWLGRTTGKIPFLKYGIGDDRLGGAKMGYLDSGVWVRVTDSFNTDYKLRLSEYHSAYIPKENVTLIKKEPSGELIHNTELSGSCRIFGDSLYDYLVLNLSRALPYRSMQLLEPSRIAIDVFGVASNTNWINQLSTTQEIKYVWYEQVEDDVMRLFIELKHAQHWGYSLSYDSSGKKLVVRVRRQPTVLDIRNLRIAIDAGHGGDNAGTSNAEKTMSEKKYTLEIAQELQKVLDKAGITKVFMTRTKDTSLSMIERLELLKDFNPDLLVSIHLNAADADSVQGVSTYYRYIGFKSLSTSILDELLTLKLKEFGNIGNFNFALNGPTDYPNTLVELAFLSNHEDERKIASQRFQRAAAQKIYLGIVDWLKQISP